MNSSWVLELPGRPLLVVADQRKSMFVEWRRSTSLLVCLWWSERRLVGEEVSLPVDTN